MKIIKSASYIEKEGQWNLPGDPSLPPGVTQRMIDERYNGPEDEQSEETDEVYVDVNWPDFLKWYSETEDEIPSMFSGREGSTLVTFNVSFEHTSYDNSIKIKDVLSVFDEATKTPITDPKISSALQDYCYSDIIKEIRETLNNF
jgi:hypothetical protein